MYYPYEPFSGLATSELATYLFNFLSWELEQAGLDIHNELCHDGNGFSAELIDPSKFKRILFTGTKSVPINQSLSNIGIRTFTIQTVTDRLQRWCPERHDFVKASETKLTSLTLKDVVEFVKPKVKRIAATSSTPGVDEDRLVSMIAGLFQEMWGSGKRQSKVSAREFVKTNRDKLDFTDVTADSNVMAALKWISRR